MDKKSYAEWLVIGSLFLLLTTQCFRPSTAGESVTIPDEYWRGEYPDAKSWLEEFEDAVTHSFGYSYQFHEGLPHLPAPEAWPAVIEGLEQFEGKSRDQNHDKQAIATFTHLLKGEQEPLIATVLEKPEDNEREIDDYKWRQKRELLLMLGVPPGEVEKQLAQVFTRAKQDHHHEEGLKPWQKALRKGEHEQGLKLLAEVVAKEMKDDDLWTPLAAYYQASSLLKYELHTKDAFQRVEKFLEAVEVPRYSHRAEGLLNHLIDNGELEVAYSFLERARRVRKKEKEISDFDELYYKALVAKEESGKALESMLSDLKELKGSRLDYLTLLRGQRELAVLYITSLKDQGQREEAVRLCRELIACTLDFDELYKLHIELDSEGSAEFFKKIRAYDPFEERPVMWLGHLELQRGNLDAARKLVDRAIALDPSDGDQGVNTRMQVYNVLADILEKQGDLEKAKFFREVTTAIREGEKADKFLHAELHQEAIRRYKEALKHFEDAYCLQSRLAKTYLEQNNVTLAMVHFEKAFELMPVSFGPVESHCFGCEGIFDDKRVHQLAQESFARMIAKRPDNPRTYYLLGLLLEEMKKPEEAFSSYEKAFALDPDYFNCLRRMVNLTREQAPLFKKYPEIRAAYLELVPFYRKGAAGQYLGTLEEAWRYAEKMASAENPLGLKLSTLPFEEGTPKTGYYHSKVQAIAGWRRPMILRMNNLRDLLW